MSAPRTMSAEREAKDRELLRYEHEVHAAKVRAHAELDAERALSAELASALEAWAAADAAPHFAGLPQARVLRDAAIAKAEGRAL